MTVPYIFANAVGLVPASELDVNFAYVNNNVSTANTVASNAQPNITSVGTLINLSVAGNVIAARLKGEGGNISNIRGANVSGVVANATYAVTANSAVYSTNSIQTNIANIAYLVTGSNVSGSVAQANIANIANAVTGSNVSGSVAQANIANIANAVTGGNVSGQVANALISGTVYTNAQPNITSVGTLTSLSTSGNITGGNLLTSGLVSATGNTTGGNLLTGGLVSATGNITGGNLSGTNIVGTLLTANQTNITSVGTLDSLSATGNIAGARLITSSFVSAVGNVTAGNVRTVGLISATGNVTGNNVSAVTAFQLPVYANTTTRDTAISTPTIGMLIVVGNTYQGYNGASWGNITLT